MNQIKGTPTKLKSGDWGARVKNQVHRLTKGDEVLLTVETKAGKSWEQYSRIIWADNNVALAAKVDRSANTYQRTYRKSYVDTSCDPTNPNIGACGECHKCC